MNGIRAKKPEVRNDRATSWMATATKQGIPQEQEGAITSSMASKPSEAKLVALIVLLPFEKAIQNTTKGQLHI